MRPNLNEFPELWCCDICRCHNIVHHKDCHYDGPTRYNEEKVPDSSRGQNTRDVGNDSPEVWDANNVINSPSGEPASSHLSGNFVTQKVGSGKVNFIPVDDTYALSSGEKPEPLSFQGGVSSKMDFFETNHLILKTPPVVAVFSKFSVEKDHTCESPEHPKPLIVGSLQPSILHTQAVKTSQLSFASKTPSLLPCKSLSSENLASTEVVTTRDKRNINDGTQRSQPSHIEPVEYGVQENCELDKIYRGSDNHAAAMSSVLSEDHLCKEEDADAVHSEEDVTSKPTNLFDFLKEDLPNPPATNASWKGSFEIFNITHELYDGFQAHLAVHVSQKAYFASKRMPGVLQFTLQPRRSVWPKIFPSESPSGHNIAIYLFADDICRPRENYKHLLQLMEAHDLSMQSRVDDAELLVFTSRHLPVESQRLNMQFYLWGVFLSFKGRKSSIDSKVKQHNVHSSLLSYRIEEDPASIAQKADTQAAHMDVFARIPPHQPVEESHVRRDVSRKKNLQCVMPPRCLRPHTSYAACEGSNTTSLLKMPPVSHQGLGICQKFASDCRENNLAQPNVGGLENVEEEEDELVCMVCRKGYTLRPTDMLGIYAYSKWVNLDTGTSTSSRGECVYTTVSRFNIIHFQCDRKAKQEDAALGKPKKAWEGATIRNNMALCNCIFPLKGPFVPMLQYIRCVSQYWDSLYCLGIANGSRLDLLTHDIVQMLMRYARGSSFSMDGKSGGRVTNIRLLPFMIQMARHFIDQGGSTNRISRAETVSNYLRKPKSSSPARTVQFMMVSSLLYESYESWLNNRRAFLQRAIYHAYMEHRKDRSMLHAAKSKSRNSGAMQGSKTGGSNLFSIIHPMLVYTGLIEQLQRFFKLKKSNEVKTVKTDESGSNTDLEDWEVIMKEKVVNLREMLSFPHKLLSWLMDMNSAVEFKEVFRVMGALSDLVVSGRSSKCEDFIKAAIQARRD